MSERGNIQLVGVGESVYLYTRTQGNGLKGYAANALARYPNLWQGGPACFYHLASMVFCELLCGQEPGWDWDGSGHGISLQLQENEFPIVVLDCATKMVTTTFPSHPDHGDDPINMSFKDFANEYANDLSKKQGQAILREIAEQSKRWAECGDSRE